MNTTIKIGIVEDELLIAEKIKTILTAIGYEVCEPAINYDAALAMIASEKPDLLLLDINLKEKKDGIHIAETVNKEYGIPFIFLSANTDGDTLERAKAVSPLTFLPKPFTKAMLYTTIEIAFNNYNLHKQKSVVELIETSNVPTKQANKEYLFVKDGTQFRKVYFKDIIYMDSDTNYVTIYLPEKKKILMRTTLTDFEALLPSEDFMRIHRSYVINLLAVETVERLEVILTGNTRVSIGLSFKDELMKRLGIE